MKTGRATVSVQTYARIAGILFLVSFVAGGFGEFFVPSALIVPGDATATANNIVASDTLLRMGFAGYLVEAMCDVALALILRRARGSGCAIGALPALVGRD